MSAASYRDAMLALTAAFRKHYGDESAMAGHVGAYHLKNALDEAAYVDYYRQRDKRLGWMANYDERMDMDPFGRSLRE